MDPSDKYTPRERAIRIVGGLLITVLGAVAFVWSKRTDPGNRWGFVGILMVLFGLSWAGQGIRGRREGPISHDEEPPPGMGPAVSPERAVAGILAAWVVPGLGHWLIGRRAKAVLFFTVITVTFLAGVLLAEGRNLSWDRDWVYFLAYGFNAGETLLGFLLTRHLEVTHKIPYLQIGFLYTAVACLLNLVAMMDFASTCSRSAPAGEAAGDAPGSPEGTA